MASRILKTTLSRLFTTEVVETPELLLSFTRECMEQVDRMTKSSTVLKVNHEQCKYLAGKLKMAVQSAASFLEFITTWYSPSVSAEDVVRSLEVFKLLLGLGKEVEILIAGCCKDPWVQSAIMLANVWEHVLSLGLNLELCSIIFSNRKKFVALPSVEVSDVALVRETEAQIVKEMAELDAARLVEDVSVVVESSRTSSLDFQLATFLRDRLKSPREFPNPDLLGSNESAYFEILDQGLNQLHKLGGGAFGTVYKARWLGVDVAKKTFHGPSVEDLIQEVSILEGLCHPNIVSLLWYRSYWHKSYIVMELMDSDLSTLIQDRLEGCAADDNPFSISEAMHIIAQVAEGVYFLHQNKIVHRDLKSGNILVRHVKTKGVNATCIQVKVADFGLSRTRENSATASSLTLNRGTTRWMSPELIKLANNHDEIDLSKCEERLHYPFKVDVFSFGMLCYEVLSGQVPFSSTSKPNEVRRKILAGDRPQLPNQCPEGLRTLIKKCWNPDPRQRPSFAEICAELRQLRCGYFITSTWARAPRCFSLDEIWKMTNDFSKDNLLSWKALTMVYKGVTIDTGETVAVKRILEENFQALDEFKTQLELLAGLHHKNLVRTVGFCHAEEAAILVFEYMPNDTLDTCLSDALTLTWPVRRNICVGVANGIYYLHSVAQPRIIHRHIRRWNIMLDQNFEPKIASLDSALLSFNTRSDFQSPRLGAAPLGYIAPEYITSEEVSEKGDVYSFGVLLLEIVSGRRNIDPRLPEGQRELGEWAREFHSQGRIKELIDPALDLRGIEETEALRTILIALLCMHTAAETRPEMSLVLAMLQGNLDEEILRLGLQSDKELFGMNIDDLPDSFGSSSGAFGSSSRWKLDRFVRAEGRLADEWSADPSDSRDGQDLEKEAQIGLEYLSSTSSPKVREGFAHLIKCASRPGGPFAVFSAQYSLAPAAPPGLPMVIKAIPAALKLAGDTQYSKLAMKLMVVLTTNNGVGPDDKIILEVSDGLDVLISFMKDGNLNSISLLAAETVGNILVNKQVRKTLCRYDGFLPVLGAFLHSDAPSQGMKHLERANDLGLKVLQRLAKCSESIGDKAQLAVRALIKLLRRGLGDPVLMNLAKDTLVLLDTQVLRRLPTLEICLELRSQLLELMVTDGLITHSTIPGRIATISLMTKLYELYKEGITEGLCLYLLKMMRLTGFEIMQLSNVRENGQELNDLKRLLDLSVRLLCLCVTHGLNSFEATLTKNVAERRTLEVLLEQDSGVPDESKVGILELLDHIDQQSIRQRPTPFGEVAILVKLATSQSPSCRAQVASRLLKFATLKLHNSEMDRAGGINALMDLLNDTEVDCQQDALLALYRLSPSASIRTEKLPLKIILGFLHPKWPSNVRDASAGFLYFMVKESAANAKTFMQTPEALTAVLDCLDRDAENPGDQKSVSALLIMATEEDDDVRLGIAGAGLSILVTFVQRLGTIEHKKFLTIMLGLLCKSGGDCEEAVTRANGHTFLLTSLQEKNLKSAAALGLLSLLGHARSRGDVLQAGFVEIAMESIDRENASTETALALASVCSTLDGLDQVVACSRSVGALLILLERCPTIDGKGAAAAVIAKLYPRLNSQEDIRWQVAELIDACCYLIKYLGFEDRSQVQEFLKALAAFAADKKGRQTIHEERGQAPLMRFLRDMEIDSQVRDLVLQILAEMSRVFADGVTTRDSSYHKILNVFLDFKIGILLCELFENDEFRENTESMRNMLFLIRNLSLSGPAAISHLSDAGAVNLLLKVLNDHSSSLSPVTELAVKALMKFADDPAHIKALLYGGIRSLVTILKLDFRVFRESEVSTIIPIILTWFAQDPRIGGAACTAIFYCDILPALNTIMYDGETSRIKWQAAVLTKLLATTGPTKRVCAAIFKAGTLDALFHLRKENHCEDIANDILKFLRGKNSDCRKYIDESLRWPR